MPGDPFVLETPPSTPVGRAAFTAARPFLAWVLQTGALADVYRTATSLAGRFEDQALRALEIDPQCHPADLARVPRTGPLVVAANHPHGALDGLVLASLFARVRPDVRLIANHLLARIPELRESCFFVDPFDGPEAAARSRAGLRAAHLWLRRGGAVVLFPSGTVAPTRDAHGVPVDAEWHSTVGRLAAQTGAPVLPVHIDGRNSQLFYALGRLHPLLRTALLSRECLKARGREISVRIGAPLAVARAEGASAAAVMITTRARAAVEQLTKAERTRDVSHAMDAEMARLPQEACLVSSGSFKVFCASAPQIPLALQEIGRLRAVAYAAAGEGSGKAVDLDAFDERYLHLFSWDTDARRIVGAYRIGRSDAIVPEAGVEGLYTRTLFHYDRAFIDRLAPALELGRSFVRREYQRNHTALLLLWKGIGRFVVRHPEYRVLFGPVSISSRYADASHDLLRAFLRQNCLDRSLADLVQALNPPRVGVSAEPVVPSSLEDADRAIAASEPDGKGMPVLLRQYLKLGARLVGFNVDDEFGDVVDALMMVDLAAVDRAILGRYMGRDEAATFLLRHRTSSAAA